jgi:serine/threonine-protein kinase RIO1
MSIGNEWKVNYHEDPRYNLSNVRTNDVDLDSHNRAKVKKSQMKFQEIHEEFDADQKVRNEMVKNYNSTLEGTSKNKDKKDHAVTEHVLDKKTKFLLERLMANEIIIRMGMCISSGKEANVYWGEGRGDLPLPDIVEGEVGEEDECLKDDSSKPVEDGLETLKSIEAPKPVEPVEEIETEDLEPKKTNEPVLVDQEAEPKLVNQEAESEPKTEAETEVKTETTVTRKEVKRAEKLNRQQRIAVTRESNKKYKELAIKIYRVETMVFRDRGDYITGERRFRKGNCTSNPRKMIKLWAEKEFRNLKRIEESQLNCPHPIDLRDNLIVMEFLGKDKEAYPRLIDVKMSGIDESSECYLEVIKIIRVLYMKCNLVHADLSEYNL